MLFGLSAALGSYGGHLLHHMKCSKIAKSSTDYAVFELH